MNCDEVVPLLAADVDGEVDGLRSHAIRKHVAGCALCAPRAAAVRDLRQRLRTELPYHAAPAALRARLLAGHAGPQRLPRVPAVAAVLDLRRRWFGAGMLAGGALACGVWIASVAWQNPGFGDDLSGRVVGLHVRATLGNHLVDVTSSDRHTVKPWLSARLDYSIPVIDAASAGFPLVGARIDRLDGHPVATLVYRRRAHVIDVFVRPEPAPGSPPDVHSVRGFNVATAQGAGMAWIATSDLQGAELASFVQGLARGQVVPQAE